MPNGTAEVGRGVHLRLKTSLERVRASLFFIPMLGVVAAIVLSQVGIAVDDRFDTARWPLGLTSTVESARAVLSTIASATITFAGIAFSISLLLIQLASSQYSPRVVHTLFRDPYNKRVMALVVATFTYCLIVLRAVRSSLEQGGEPVIPNLSVRWPWSSGRHDPRHRRLHQPQRARDGRQGDPRPGLRRGAGPDQRGMAPRRSGRTAGTGGDAPASDRAM